MDLTQRPNQRVIDATVVVAGLLLTWLAVKAYWTAMPRPVIAIAGVAGSAALVYRRRLPVPVTAVAAAAYALSGNPWPLLVALYTGVAHARRWELWVLTGLGWAGFEAWFLLDNGRWEPFDALYAVALTLPVVGLGLYMATRRALYDALRDRVDRIEHERYLYDERARAAERTRIAREMHDVLAHKVSLIALHAGALELNAGGSGQVQKSATLIRVTAREALQELRGVLGVLRTGETGSDGAADGLDALVRASTLAGQQVELRDDAGTLPAATARVVFRTVQEGLTNAHRYAPGATVEVSVTRTDGGAVQVTVRNGPPAGTPTDLPGSGSGLIGLAERVRIAGGSLDSGPDGAGGWQLRAVVPEPADDAGFGVPA